MPDKKTRNMHAMVSNKGFQLPTELKLYFSINEMVTWIKNNCPDVTIEVKRVTVEIGSHGSTYTQNNDQIMVNRKGSKPEHLRTFFVKEVKRVVFGV